MMLYQMTTQYQAERIKTAAEQRRVDDQLGMLAAEVSGLWRRLIRSTRILRRQARTPLYAR